MLKNRNPIMNLSLQGYFFILVICGHFSEQFTLASPQASKSDFSNASNTAPSRNVYVVTDIYTDKKFISPRTGQPTYGGHALLEVDGNDRDGPLTIELGPGVREPRSTFAIRCMDIGVAHTGRPIDPYIGPTVERHIISNGETTLKNAQLFDHIAGTGFAADAWNEDPVYVYGTGSKPNTCFEFIERVVAKMRLQMDPRTRTLFDNSRDYYRFHRTKKIVRVSETASIEVTPYTEKMDQWQTRLFDVDFVENPKAPELLFRKVVYHPSSWLSGVQFTDTQ